jgi:hypothetical protein
MPVDSQGRWQPTLFDRQLDVFNSYARVLLVTGPRLGGKTIAICHRICRHLWETDGARIGFFCRTLKTSKQSGSWALLNGPVLHEWFANLDMRYTSFSGHTPGQKVDGITRLPFFKVNNIHGTESEAMLFSLDNDDEVEAKLKEMEFTMIFFSELDKFGDRRVLTVALPSLRKGNVTFEERQWLADCNPAEEGDASWIYRVFYRERQMSYPDYLLAQKAEDLPLLSEEDFTAFYRQMTVIEMLPKDNPFADPRQLQEIRVACAGDAGLYARHVEGKWVWGGGDSSRHFRALWGDGSRHLVEGSHCEGPEEEWVVAVPSVNCYELISGHDLGDVNKASVIIEKYTVGGKSCFCILDELVRIGETMSNEDFTVEFMEKIEALEAIAGKRFNLDQAWSDRSSIERYSASSDAYPYQEVMAASRGRIILQAVRKAQSHNSIRLRVSEMKRLLIEGRIKVSAHCTATISMFKNLRKGKALVTHHGKSSYEWVVWDRSKHVFDAISYAILATLSEEVEASPRVQHKTLIEAHIG